MYSVKEMINAHKILVGKPEGRGSLENIDIYGRIG
jgi:hypothetical protein